MSNRFIIMFMAFSLLLQACATTRVETTLIPGKEVASTLLGRREIDNKIVLEEITPLSVKLFRRVSSADYTGTVHLAIKEDRHETTTYDCSANAYREYVSIMVVNLAAPLLYELATKFKILHDICDKNPPSYVIETAATDKTLSIETYDKEKIIISEIPLAGELVTAQLDGNSYTATTSAAGIATYTRAEVAPLQNIETDVDINYQYNDSTLTTRLSGKGQHYRTGTADPYVWPQLSWVTSADSASTQAETDTVATFRPLPYPYPLLAGGWYLWVFRPFQGESQEGDGVIMTMPAEQSAAKSAAAGNDEASVTIAAKSTAGKAAAGEWKTILKIKFDTNKATIRKEYYPRLKEIGEALKKNPQLTGVIEGHTDNVGSKELNKKISIRRAGAVAQHLIKTFAISADRLKVEGYGMSSPIAANSTPSGRAKNRRIEAKFKDLN